MADTQLLLEALKQEALRQTQASGVTGTGNLNSSTGQIQLNPQNLQALQSSGRVPVPPPLPQSALLGLQGAGGQQQLNPGQGLFVQRPDRTTRPDPGGAAGAFTNFFQGDHNRQGSLPNLLLSALGFAPGEPQGQEADIAKLLGQIQGSQGAGQAPGEPSAAPGPPLPRANLLSAPELGPLRSGQAPDFQSALAALGPEVKAQQVGQGEALSRTFGGGAAGGLQAVQNAPSGRAASLGEVIAGAGAGIAGARGNIGIENRQLEELARNNESLRKKQVSSIKIAEEAAVAEQSQASADAFNTRELQKAQMQLSVSAQNAQLLRPVPVADGIYLPGTGEFIKTKQQTFEEIFQSLLLIDEAYKGTTERTGVVLGQSIVLDNLSPIMQKPVIQSFQAMSNPLVLDAFLETLKESGQEDLASNIKRVSEGKLSSNSDESKAIAARGAETMAHMFLINQNNPNDPPYPFLLDFQSPAFNLPGVQTTADLENMLSGLGAR